MSSANIKSLSDDFNDGVIDATKWVASNYTGASYAETGGVIQFSVGPTSASYINAGITSLNTYDLTNSEIAVKVATYSSRTSAGEAMSLYLDSNNYIQVYQSDGNLYKYIKYSGGSSLSSVFFDSTQHKYWKLRHSGSNIYVDTSPDGTNGSWTNQFFHPLEFAITDLKAALSAYMYGPQGSGIVSAFDNLNTQNNSYVINSTISGSGTVTLGTKYETFSITSTISGGGKVTILRKYQPLAQKDYEYRVYDHSRNYIGVLQGVDSAFTYSQNLNENASSLNISVARSPNNRIQLMNPLKDLAGANITDTNGDPIYIPTSTSNAVGPGTDIELNYNVDIYAFYGGYDDLLDVNGNQILDMNGESIIVPYGAPNGLRVYSGYIADYELVFGNQTGVNVVLVPQATDMSHTVFKSGTTTTITYSSIDPVQMARNNMDNYISQGGVITYTAASMPLSGTTQSYPFKLQTTKEVNDKVISLLPSGWYQYVHPGENVLYMLNKGVSANHTFYYEKHLKQMNLRKSITQLVNKVYFTGGDTGTGYLYKYYEDTTSQTTYRAGLDRISDSRVTTATGAQALAQQEIDQFKNPRYRTTIVILDKDYDIETIRLGQMVAFKNFGNFVDSLLLQIVSITKETHQVSLDLDMVVPSDTKRLIELKKQLLQEEIRNIGTAPS